MDAENKEQTPDRTRPEKPQPSDDIRPIGRLPDLRPEKDPMGAKGGISDQASSSETGR